MKLPEARAVAISLAGIAAFAMLASMNDGPSPLRPTDTPVPKGWILKKDGENHWQGPFIAYAGDWSTTTKMINLRRSIDYEDRILINPKTFPAQTLIEWRWPNSPAKTGVYGYMHLAYGYYAGGITREKIAPVRVADLGAIHTDFTIEMTGDPAHANVLSETFLTSAPGDFNTKVIEVGFLPSISASGRSFFDAGEQLGAWTDPSGRVWNVAAQAEYFMFIPAKGRFLSGRLDFAAALRWLMAKKRVTGKEWFNGLAIGVEPVQGFGKMKIVKWRVYNPAGK